MHGHAHHIRGREKIAEISKNCKLLSVDMNHDRCCFQYFLGRERNIFHRFKFQLLNVAVITHLATPILVWSRTEFKSFAEGANLEGATVKVKMLILGCRLVPI